VEQILHRLYMQNYHNSTLQEIIIDLKERLASCKPRETLSFDVLNPDIQNSTYNGNKIEIGAQTYIYRGYKTWLDLAHLLGCKMLTPLQKEEHIITLRYEKLNQDASFHTQKSTDEQKYGSDSIFSEIHKNEEAAFAYYYLQALQNAGVNKRKRILNLGVNSGDEFEAILPLLNNANAHEFVGIDYCESAIERAKERFGRYKNITFYKHNINDLETLNLGEFDLIISIGTLQSSNLEYNRLLMSIVQNQLKRDGAMILGFANCRWIDGEMVYGARVKNYSFSEMGLLYKDAIFAKKYLQQKKFRVTLTGKDYIFLTATSVRKDL